MSIAALFRVLPPPPVPVEVGRDWTPVEARLGTPLPDDYKAFIARYGSGTTGRFFMFFNPFSGRPTLDLVEQARACLAALRSLHDDFAETLPFPLHPESGGLLPVAITENGDVIYWLTMGDPDAWTIVVNEARSPDYEIFSCKLTTWLADLVGRRIACRAFPSALFPQGAAFAPI